MNRKVELSEENYDLLDEVIHQLCEQGRLLEEQNAMQHGSTSVYEHSVNVAYKSLHDYFLYDWHEKDGGHRLHGFRHPAFALYNASKDFSLNRKERNIIARHMFPLTVLPPRCLEAWIVCFVDKYCAFSETMGDGRIQWER